MKLMTFIYLSVFSAQSLAHEDNFLSHNEHLIYHAFFWVLVASLSVCALRWYRKCREK